MTEQRCIVTSRHDADKTPRALDGSFLCKGHTAKVEKLLAELPALYDDLELMLAGGGGQAEKVTSSRDPGLKINGAVADARDEIHAELVRLVRHVSEERGFTVPADTVPALATWLTRNVAWLCAQPDADELHDNLDRLTSSCWSLAYPSGRRRFVLPEVCGTPVACDARSRELVRCDGRLTAWLMPADDREEMSEITCDTCGLEVAAAGWYSWAAQREAS